MRIDVSGVAFRYDKATILHDIDLEIPSGSLTVFCGQTGSGKSTLLQVLAGLEKPSAGRVVYSEPDERALTAIVFQQPETQLFAGTVQEDVEFGLAVRKVPKSEREQKAAEALRLVGLEPDVFGERSPYLLSGGEKRRLVIAGALASEPQVLILDEPTAGLDPAACRELAGILRELRAKGLTILVSTHDLDLFFPLADQVVALREGRVHFNGTAQELMASPEVLEAAGLELPAAARIAYRLRRKGLDVGFPVSAEDLLLSLQARVFDGEKMRCDEKDAVVSRRSDGSERQQDKETETEIGTLTVTKTEIVRVAETETERWDWNLVQSEGTLAERLDPRMKWMGMVVLSIALLQVSTLWGVMSAVALLAALIRLADVSWRRTVAYLRPFLLMFFFLWVVSAISFERADVMLGPVGISYEGAIAGGLGVLRFLFVIALGLVFTETTSGAPLREGFEWGIRPLRKLKVPVRDLSLAVSIVLQFVPWILDKLTQLRKAFASRGQDPAGMRKWTPRRLTLLVVPLLILVIKMGDELAVAIESRGYDRQVERTSWYQLRWSGRDTFAGALMIGVAALLFWLG